MTGRSAAESPSLAESERSFRVGLRADTGVYFPQGETLTLRNFPSELGPIDVVFNTNRLAAEGFTHPIRVGLWIDVQGPALSMSTAVETFGNVARGMTAILSVAANAVIEDPTADVALEVTEDSSHREFWSRDAPDYEFPSGFGRAIIPDLAAILVRAYAEHPQQDRFHRAVVQYHHALQEWEPGSEIAALAHVWIGMEALTKIARTHLMDDLGLSLDELVARYSERLSTERGQPVELRNLNELDAEIRRRHLFQGDDSTYKLAKQASDGYEHSFNPLWKVRERALQALEPATEYLRRGILEYSGIGAPARDAMLSEYFSQPFDGTLRLSLTGELEGAAETLDAMDGYPDIQLAGEPLQRGVDEEGDAEIGFRQRIAAANLPPGVTFKPVGITMLTSLAMAQGTAVLTGTTGAALSDESLAMSWDGVRDGGRSVSQVQIGDIFDIPIRAEGEDAISFDPETEYRVDAVSWPESGIDQEDVHRSVERLRTEREDDGWVLMCALPPSNEDRILRLVFRKSSPDGA